MSDGSDDQRQLFLDAGVELLEQAAAEVAMRALTVRSVTKKAGRSTGAFYHYWETQADFVRELIAHLTHAGNAIAADPLTDLVAESIGTVVDGEFVRGLFDGACDEQVRQPAMRMHMLMWAIPDDPVVLGALRSLYSVYEETFGAFYSALFVGSPARMAEGLTYEDLAIMIAVLLDGIAIRRRFDPGAAGPALAHRMIAALLTGVMVRDGDEQPSLADRLDHLLGPVDAATPST